jgi:hypothetical protein
MSQIYVYDLNKYEWIIKMRINVNITYDSNSNINGQNRKYKI